jgi:hypothetical protein
VSSVRDRLLKAAAIRRRSVVIDGESFDVVEVGSQAFSEYGALVREGDRLAGVARLLQACVVDEAGLPALSEEDSALVAGNARVCMPLLNAIMELSGFSDEAEGGGSSRSDASRAVRPSAGRAARSNGRGDARVAE